MEAGLQASPDEVAALSTALAVTEARAAAAEAKVSDGAALTAHPKLGHDLISG